MRINYKKELEDAARTMILVHSPQVLIRLIVRMIVRKVNVHHAGILLFDQAKKSYILNVSKGKLGIKIPAGFARIDPESATIRFFTDKSFRSYTNGGALTYDKINGFLRNKNNLKKNKGLEETLLSIRNQMNLFQIQVCVPSYFQEELLGVLMLGKKIKTKTFYQKELDFFVALSHDVAMALRNAQIFDALQNQINHNKRMFFETTKALATTIDAKDHYTHGHTERVTRISLAMAKKLIMDHRIKVDDKFLDDLNIAALLHDIGKIGVPEHILNKNGMLNGEERTCINGHPMIGASILEPIQDLKRVVDGVKHHHERYDGRGYPDGLKGGEISLIASIIAVADTFDAMTTDRPYRPALSKTQAIEEITRGSGLQFHPLAAEIIVELHHEKSL